MLPTYNNQVIVYYSQDRRSLLGIHPLKDGEKLRNTPISIGAMDKLNTDPQESEEFIRFSSMLTRDITYGYDFTTDKSSVLYAVPYLNSMPPNMKYAGLS
jgi:protease II